MEQRQKSDLAEGYADGNPTSGTRAINPDRSKRPLSIIAFLHKKARFARYVFSGVANTIITYVIYLILLTLLSYRLAYTATFVCGIVTSYFFNARYVFRVNLRLAQALLFAAVYVTQYLGGLGILYVLVEIFRLPASVAPLLLILLIVPSNYLLNRWIIAAR